MLMSAFARTRQLRVRRNPKQGIGKDWPLNKAIDEDSSAPAGSDLAAEDVGEVCRKDELVVGDYYGLVLRSGLSEETGHAGDCLNDDVSAE
jgi:hypothetical protein